MVDLSTLKDKSLLLSGYRGLIGNRLWEEHKRVRTSISVAVDTRKEPYARIDGGADFIIHAAGYGQPDKFMADPIGTIKVNTETLIDLLDRLKPGGKFLYLSTSELYSGSWKASHSESDIGRSDPWHPRAAYIEGKRCGEAICAAYRRKGVDVKVARVSLAYGPGTKKGDSRVLNQFIEQALTTGKIILRDQGHAVRTYCYIDDAVEMLWNILLHGGQSTYNAEEMLRVPAENPVYNVAGFSKVTIRELAETIAEMTSASIVIPHGDYGSPGAPDHVSVDVGKYLNEFGKDNWTDLRDGLAKTIEYQRGLYAA